MVSDGFDPSARYRAQLLMLMMLPDADEPTRQGYWKWLSEALLNDVREESPELFQALLKDVRAHIRIELSDERGWVIGIGHLVQR